MSVWNDIKDVIEAASAKAVDGRPCATMNGKGGAGSCVKMYHNAGEYAILQIWAEASAVMKAWGISGEKQAEILTSWKSKSTENHPNFLNSYMLDITTEVCRAKDTETGDGSMLASKALDVIGSKGTGLWSVQEALGAGCPAGTLGEAVQAIPQTFLSNPVATPTPPVESTRMDLHTLFATYFEYPPEI